jgi:hypothetical protein
MRRMAYVVAVALSVVLSVSAFASSRDSPERPRDKRTPIVKVVKKAIKALGDFLDIPTP